jgi:glycosyltransferase involved in cell wall biosynthesis
MKILHVTPSYKPAFIYGGPTVSVSRLCEELARAGADVSVYTTTANGSEELDVTTGEITEADGVHVTYFSRMTGDHTHFSPVLLYRLWRSVRQFDVVHIHSWWNLVSVLAVLICLLRDVRPILAPRGMLSAYSFSHENSLKKKLIHTLLGRWLLPRTLLHATTALEVRDCQKIVPTWDHFILPNIIHLPETIPKRRDRKDKTLQLIFLSRVDPKKGLELLFSALEKVDFPYRLSIYGNRHDVYEEKLRKLSEDLGIAQNLHWEGWVGPEEKFERLAEADLFVLTSYNENFANVVLESLAVGTPALLSTEVGMADYVAEKQFGWVCTLNAEDVVKKLNDACKRLMLKASDTLAVDLQQVLQDFDGPSLAKKYVKAYSKSLL